MSMRAASGSLARRCLSTARAHVRSSAAAWAACVSPAGVAASRPSVSHEVTNQASPLSDYDAFAADPSLQEALCAANATWATDDLSAFGSLVGSAHWQAEAAAANAHPPRLETHNRFGRRTDVVHYHPSYHNLMRLGIENGVHSIAWAAPELAGAQTARGIHHYLMYQVCASFIDTDAIPLRRACASLGRP